MLAGVVLAMRVLRRFQDQLVARHQYHVARADDLRIMHQHGDVHRVVAQAVGHRLTVMALVV